MRRVAGVLARQFSKNRVSIAVGACVAVIVFEVVAGHDPAVTSSAFGVLGLALFGPKVAA